MHMQVRLDVFELNQLGQLASFRCFHLAAIFTQLRRDVLQTKRLIYFLFGGTKDLTFAFGFRQCML